MSNDGSTTIPQGSTGKRPEAPSFAKANDDIVSPAWKHAAVHKRTGFGTSAPKLKVCFNQVCGYTPQSNTKFTGLNAVSGPTSGRRIFAGSASADEGLTSSDTFTLDLIDKAKENAIVGDNMVRPIRIKGQKKYVMFLHPYQVTALRTNSSSGQWLDIQKAAMAGIDANNSPIYTGALGEYNGVILKTSQDVTQGVNSSSASTAVTTVRRAVLLGAQAACCAYGGDGRGSSDKYRWNEELLDHKRKLEVSAWSIWGCKKTVFNSADFGTVVVSTYAAAAS